MNDHVAFLLQVPLLLGAARLFGEIMRRMNQPPILGELMAGIVLGPSVLGALWPAGQAAIFGDIEALNHVSKVGLVLLMLLIGLETDIRVIRNMGRAAFMTSLFGMVIPFASGLLLAMQLDESFVLKGRLPLALFLATAMAISAMPVIAKILMDLKMMKRNFAIVILSAAVVDDTCGWIVLALVSGIVLEGSVEAGSLLAIVGSLAAFLLLARFALYPVMKWVLPRAEHVLRLPGGELVFLVIVTFLCAAATAAMQVHEVFGAFVAGVVFRQCPTVSGENLRRLETVTLSLLAPLFFGAIGLRVDFASVQGFWLPLVVIAIAIAGKVGGCLLGGLLARMPFWEAMAVGFGMSARGAMELVAAQIGLDLGILGPDLFSVVVLVAVVTSLLAPLSLRTISHRLPLSEEEKLREVSAEGGMLPAGPVRILVPAGGGTNALLGSHLAAHLCHAEGDRCVALHVETGAKPAGGAWLSWRPGARSVDTAAYFKSIQEAAGAFGKRVTPRSVPVGGSVLETILAESAKGYHLLVVGASGQEHPLYDPFISELVRKSPCHLAIVSGRPGGSLPFKSILVPTNGSYFSDAAFEVAARYADAANARVSVLYVAEARQRNPLLPAAAVADVSDHTQDMLRVTLREQFAERWKHSDRLECHVRESETVISGLVEEVRHGSYDLVVLGAENKSFVERLYLGQHIEAAVAEVPCAIALIIPKIGSSR